MRRKNNYTEFGLMVKEILLAKNITQKELSKRTGITEQVITDLFVGRNKKEEHKQVIIEVLNNL